MPAEQNFWDGLFGAKPGPSDGVRVEMRLLKKHGRPLLLLPCHPRAAVATLSLYPAQTTRARAARALLSGLLRFSAPYGTEPLSLAIPPDDAFVKFLAQLVGASPGELPPFGILAGNSASAGQRFLVLVFDAAQRPVFVVKAGLTQPARALIEQEQYFLKAAPPDTAGLPKLRATFECPRLLALALDFFPGDSPRKRQERAIPSLLGSWLNAKRKISVSETACWQALERSCPGDALLVTTGLRERIVQAAVQHGDFAPWNIKVSPGGDWRVLDWERGQVTGLPGWDWFHYVIQTALLVERQPAAALVERVENLLSSESFRSYATQSGFRGSEREWVLAYLFHTVHVVKPSEGLPQTQELLKALCERWPKRSG
jgi:hypothetical protein